MNRILLISSAALLCALPASAATVVADFNDLTLGDPRSSNLDQTANSGTGFSDSYWAVNTGIPRIVSGDLTAASGTNYAVVQNSGGGFNARSFQSTNYTINDATDRRQARTLSTSLSGDVWFSFLVHNAASDHSAGLDFNIATTTFSTSVASRVVVEGTTLRVINGANIESASVADVGTLGQTMLVVGRLSIEGSIATPGQDTLSVWINPTLPDNPEDLGAATWSSADTNFLGSASSISVLGIQSYSTLIGSAQFGGVLDAVRLSDGVDGYYNVSGITAIPEPAHAGLMFGGIALAGAAAISRRRSPVKA